MKAVEEVITQLEAQKEQAMITQDFQLAAEIRDRVEAVKQLLSWYQAIRGGQ